MNESNSDGKTVTEKRASYENIEVVKADNSHFNVVNRSHNDDSNHTYTVDVDPQTGSAEACRCPDFRFRKQDAGEACKHMLAVEEHIDSGPTVDTSTDTRALADGGVVAETTESIDVEDRTDINQVAEQLAGKTYYGEVTVLSENEISVRSTHVMLGRLFELARDHGFGVDQVFPNVGDTELTDVVLKRQ